MREVSVTDAKAHLRGLLREVENGEQITITRRGRAIAVLTTPHEPLPSRAEWRARQPRRARDSADLIRDMRDEGV